MPSHNGLSRIKTKYDLGKIINHKGSDKIFPDVLDINRKVSVR